MKKIFWLIFASVLLYSCSCNNTGEKKVVPEINKEKLPQVQVKIKRYEKALFGLDQDKLSDELKRIQPQYPVFLEGDLTDKGNLMQMREYLNDKNIIDNYDACIKKYPDLTAIENELSLALSYYKYYFPEKKIPAIYSYVSGGDFEEPVKNTDSALIIALDIYLGKDYTIYKTYGVPVYKAQYMESEYIVRDCMEEIAISACANENQDLTFLDQMLNMGRVMYFLDLTLPQTDDTIKIKYPKKKLDWCYANEGNIWSFFIENKLLYTKNSDNFKKFFGDGPFTSSFGKESPSRIAVWVGWQIIRAFMKEFPATDFKKLIAETDSQKILQSSKYKPKKEK